VRVALGVELGQVAREYLLEPIAECINLGALERPSHRVVASATPHAGAVAAIEDDGDVVGLLGQVGQVQRELDAEQTAKTTVGPVGGYQRLQQLWLVARARNCVARVGDSSAVAGIVDQRGIVGSAVGDQLMQAREDALARRVRTRANVEYEPAGFEARADGSDVVVYSRETAGLENAVV
jgi:hypothetical protein